MYRANLLKARLGKGERVFGVWSGLASPFAAEIMALAGFDFIIFDHEHGLGDLTTLAHQFQAVQATTTTALVRVASHDPNLLKRVLDHGAEGVVVPNVATADEARAIVSACRYPPKGTRGAAPSSVRASSFGMAPDYARTAADNTLIICQIESVEGVENAEPIAAIEGVDLVFIGPYDLSGSAGLLGEMAHPRVVELIEKAERGVRAAAKPLGTILRPGLRHKELYELGYHLIAAGSDLSRLREACLADVKAVRALLDR